jgi:hypothetical protein
VRLTRRCAIPAALAALALAVPAGTAVADHQPNHQDNRSCPNNVDWVMWPAALAPRDKDNNEDGAVCKRTDKILDDNPTKDNNNPPDDDMFVDNEFLGIVEEILPLP